MKRLAKPFQEFKATPEFQALVNTIQTEERLNIGFKSIGVQ
jgi:hypothetical protein